MMPTNNSANNDSDNEFRSFRGPGREISTPLMSEKDQNTVESILQQKCKDAITSLSEYLTDRSSEEQLKKINESISRKIRESINWDTKTAHIFRIPSEEIKELLGEKYMAAATKVSKDPEDEDSFNIVDEARFNMYHFVKNEVFGSNGFKTSSHM